MSESAKNERTPGERGLRLRHPLQELMYLGAILVAYLFVTALMDHLSHSERLKLILCMLFGNGMLLLFAYEWLKTRGMQELGLGRWILPFLASFLLCVLLPRLVAWPVGLDSYLLVMLIPFSEELYFRGILLDHLLVNVGRAGAVALTTVLFATLHAPQGTFLPMLVLGLVLAVVTVKTKKVTWAIFLHVLWNFAVVWHRNW